MEVSVYVDITTVCRICLTQRGTVNVFQANDKEKEEKSLLGYSIAERIMCFACVEVQHHDGLPSNICFKCQTEVDQAFKLKAQCEYADATLRQLCSENDPPNNVICFMADEETGPEADCSHISDSQATGVDNDVPIDTDECTTADHFADDDILSVEGNEESSVSADKENKHKSNYKLAQSFLQDPNQLLKTTKLESCIECGEQFPNKKKLEIHSLSYPGHRPFLCKLCGKRFKRLSNLTEHEKRHMGSKQFLCSDCGQFAAGKKNHYCTVINDKSDKGFACDICKKKFVSQTTLFTHKKRHGTQSKFQCSECQKLYFSKQELERHVRVHLNVRPFQCPEEDCSLTFYSQGELNRHLRYHKGIKRFSCSLCGQKFFESGHLATHERKHTGERPYSCRYCPKAFKDSSKLRRHSLCHTELPSWQKGALTDTSEQGPDRETKDCDNHHIAIEENINVIEVQLENSPTRRKNDNI